jgi:hypothetical protein
MKYRVVFVAFAVCSLANAQVAAHPHVIESNGQVIANGMNHPAFRLIDGEYVSCDEFAHLSGYGPAWYGIETAHHGADAGDPGKGDGCYVIEGGLSPTNPASDRNPAIK